MTTRIDLLKNFRTATAAAALMTTTAGIAIALAPVGSAAAQDHGGGHEDGTEHDDESHESSQGQRGGQGRAPGEASGGQGHRGLDDIFRDIEGVDEEDSDRPDWAGGGGGSNDRGEPPADAGSTRGDLYGDMYVILRDEDGVPILNEDGFVQPIDADGNLIPLDEEGAPIDPSLALEVEISRLNIGRSPSHVLDSRAEEVLTLLGSATALELDAAGRLVVTSPDGSVKTIDAPLENLAIYIALMTTGTIPGLTDLPGTEFDFLVDGVLTVEDMQAAVSFLAAAADKFSTLTPDAVAYVNAILGIETVTEGTVTWSDVDYSTYSYDRSDAYGDVTATVLVQQPDGSWLPTEVNIYDVVFSSTDYSGVAFDAFAQAVDDSRLVIEYIHEFALPAETIGGGE